MRPLLWPFTVSSMYMDYTNILVYVNTAIFCVNNRILFPIHQKFLFYSGSLVITPVSLLWAAVFEIGCVSPVKTTLLVAIRCSQCNLSSLRYIITCTRTFLEQVSYSLVVECVLFTVQGNESDGSLCLQLSMASMVMPVLASKIELTTELAMV